MTSSRTGDPETSIQQPGPAVIETRGLTKVFTLRTRAGALRRHRRDVEAVNDIDLVVRAGEMVGYIGPNGAGKSTTIKMLTGVLAPSNGSVRVLGLEPVRQRIALARRIGVVFGQRSQLWWDLPLADSFALLRTVYRIDAATHRRNLDAFIDRLDLGPLLDTPVRQLSLGQRMRGELAAALLHDPELVFLDEPTVGLDVVSKHEVRRFLGELNREQGTTVLLTTHDLSDIEHLCRRMVIIDNGTVAYDGPLDDFRSRYGTHRTIVVDLQEEGPPLDVAGTDVVDVVGARQWLRFDRRLTSASQVVTAIVAQRAIRDLAIEEPDIEDMVRRLYDGTAHAETGPQAP
ncbi:MAG: ATP-binding cassette domain-containing protein [Acidimicrobiia bacterium]|nr:ATP-binding cassette domain-containing protein [Acidimicrobiia bacterium]